MSLAGAQRQTISIMHTTSHTDAAENVESRRKRWNAARFKRLQKAASFQMYGKMDLRKYEQ